MPSVSQLGLGRMDLWAVEGMVLARGVTASASSLGAEVFRRSGGNPYLADLLIGEVHLAGKGVFPLGGRLVDTLTASWHRLSASSRRVTQLLAIAGVRDPRWSLGACGLRRSQRRASTRRQTATLSVQPHSHSRQRRRLMLKRRTRPGARCSRRSF